MPRPRKSRFIRHELDAAAFTPRRRHGADLETVELRLDELEALRLADLEGLYHDAAAERMKISRATFGRLVAEARRKVADALVHGKRIVIRGGDVERPSMRTYLCPSCRAVFATPRTGEEPRECPSCGSSAIRPLEDRPGRGGRRGFPGGPGHGPGRRRGDGWRRAGRPRPTGERQDSRNPEQNSQKQQPHAQPSKPSHDSKDAQPDDQKTDRQESEEQE